MFFINKISVNIYTESRHFTEVIGGSEKRKSKEENLFRSDGQIDPEHGLQVAQEQWRRCIRLNEELKSRRLVLSTDEENGEKNKKWQSSV